MATITDRVQRVRHFATAAVAVGGIGWLYYFMLTSNESAPVSASAFVPFISRTCALGDVHLWGRGDFADDSEARLINDAYRADLALILATNDEDYSRDEMLDFEVRIDEYCKKHPSAPLRNVAWRVVREIARSRN